MTATSSPDPLCRSFYENHKVYTWSNVGAAGRWVRVHLQGTQRLLAVAEVRAYATALPAGGCRTGGGGGGGGGVAEGAGDGGVNCLHGRCTPDGRCECEPDWLGSDCSTHVLTAHMYLPDQIEHKWWNQPLEEEYKRRLAAFEADFCEGRGKLAGPQMLPGPAGMGAGFGSSVFWLFGEFTKAYNAGKGFAFMGHLNYARNSACKRRGLYGQMHCFYEDPAARCAAKLKAQRNKYKPLRPRGSMEKAQCLLGKACSGLDSRAFLKTPSEFSGMGLLFWRALQTETLLRPTAEMKEQLGVEALKRRIGFQHPIIGVHVRSGDGCKHGMRARLFGCLSFQDYLPDIETMATRYGTNRVFVATDSDRMLKQAKRFAHKYEIVHIDFDRAQLDGKALGKKHGAAQKIENRMYGDKGGLEKYDLMKAVMLDMELLSDCDYLVRSLRVAGPGSGGRERSD